MTPTRKYTLVSLAALVCVGIFILVNNFALPVFLFSGGSNRPADKESAIETILEWGRLAPLPASAEQLSITTDGNMFTREFHTSFIAPPAEIERWLKESPGLRETTPTVPAAGIRHFQVRPGGGAQRAEVMIDNAKNLVLIDVGWS